MHVHDSVVLQRALSVLRTPLHTLKGVGDTWSSRLKSLGLFTFWDLLSYLPRAYETYITDIEHAVLPCSARVFVRITRHSEGPPFTVSGTLIDGSCSAISPKLLYLTFFKKPLYPILKGVSYIAEGPIEPHKYGYSMRHPRLYKSAVPPKPECRAIYPLKYGLTSAVLRSAVQRVLLSYPTIPDWIPSGWNMCSMQDAFRRLHCPHTPNQDERALKRLALDELIAQQLALQVLKAHYGSVIAAPCVGNAKTIEDILHRFGCTLTPTQAQAWKCIQDELQHDRPMLRLLHGDVGSGKSIIAFLTLIQAATSNKQAALLVPTEVLAHQHAQALRALLHESDLDIAVWTGSSKKRPSADIIIGTHALFQDKSEFENLAVIVIDEQHRFGVLQRLRLVRKAETIPHILLMSATPIPRTLELTLWGHISVSCLAKRPQQGAIPTYLIRWDRILELYAWITQRVALNEAIYWVCPWIESEDEPHLGQVTERYQDLCTHFPDMVGMLHGKLTWKEKEAVLEDFANGKIKILVSTTVIEVGVHIDHASTMIIEESQRFGLAQLHQLRGRVGRGSIPGYCFLIFGKQTSQVAHARLRILRECQDGFLLAQEDMRLRGTGALCGVAQSGPCAYRFADLTLHQDLLEPAQALAQEIYAHHPHTKQFLLDLFGYHYTDLWGAG